MPLTEQVYVIQAAILIYAVLPMQKRLEKMNSAASADDTTRNYRAQLGFRVFRAKFIDMHNLPKTFLFDLYQIQSYKVRPHGESLHCQAA